MTSVFKKLQENIEFTGFCFKIPDVSKICALILSFLNHRKLGILLGAKSKLMLFSLKLTEVDVILYSLRLCSHYAV